MIINVHNYPCLLFESLYNIIKQFKRIIIFSVTNFICFPFFYKYLVLSTKAVLQEKADTAIPITTLSPPEGNTTFIDGTTWCVAHSGVSQIDLQNALDWACGLGMANCKEIQEGGACYEPDTLLSHASYAFNNYYQQNGNSDIACNFGGTAIITKNNPSKIKLSAFYPLFIIVIYIIIIIGDLA